MNRTFLLTAVLTASGVAWASGPAVSTQDSGESPHRVYTYEIELDRNGGVRQLAPHGFNPDAISAALDRQIGDWIFEAATHETAPASTRTFLRVVVSTDPETLDGFEVVSAMTGPAPQYLPHPEYPIRDQMAGRQGTVVLKLQLDRNGRVAAADVDRVTGSISRTMARSARAAALDWRFTPESTDGQPHASTILWPVCFIGAQSSVSDCTWKGPDAQRFSSKTVLTLNPAARLVSPLAYEGR
jgi:TonB family protein